MRSWLLAIAYRSFLDHARKTKRRQALSQKYIVPDAASAVVSAPAGHALDVERAMDSLSPECRAIILLCLLHGFTQAEAAKATGLPLGTIKSHIARGKAKLRTVLSDYAPAQNSDRSQA